MVIILKVMMIIIRMVMIFIINNFMMMMITIMVRMVTGVGSPVKRCLRGAVT